MNNVYGMRKCSKIVHIKKKIYIYMCVDQNMCQDVKNIYRWYTIDFRRYSGLPKRDRIRIV
jgi:hypothetical protein